MRCLCPMRIALLASLLIILGWSAPASAHGLDVTVLFPTDRPLHLRVLANFADGDPLVNGQCLLVDDQGVELARDQTNAEGACILARPGVGRYAVIVSDDEGHRRKLEFDITPEQAAQSAVSTAQNRWIGLGAGLLLIGLGTLLWRRYRRMGPPAPVPPA